MSTKNYDFCCPICGAVFNHDDDLDFDGITVVCPACGNEFDIDDDDDNDEE
jgi:uncharacterized Zn-finger protein